MENINLSDIIGDHCANSFALAFRSMFCTELQPKENQAKTLISKYLGDYECQISVYFDESVLNKYCFVTDILLRKRKMDYLLEEKRSLEYTELFNSGLYNLGMLLSIIDESVGIDADILINNSIGDYSKGALLLAKKMDMLVMIHLGISSFIIEFNQKNQQFNWIKHYNVAPNMQYIMKNQSKYQSCKEYLIQNSPEELLIKYCFLSDILLLIDLYRVKQQCILEKFMVALLFIAKSPEYDEWMQQYAYTIIDILNEIMFCGEIHRLYLQEGYYDTKSDVEKTSRDATTRMSIIFSAHNDDIYILRVDLPHKGEDSFHINMEEVVGETILSTGYPMTYEEINKWELNCDKKTFKHLFFVMNDQIWFRSRFQTILKHEDITAELRDKLKELFHKQAHISITTRIQEGNKCENQIAFIDEIKKYLKRLSIPESYYLTFKKDDIAYSKEIKKVRGLFQCEKYIMKLIFAQTDYRIKTEEVFNLFKNFMDIKADVIKGSNASSLIEVWEILEKLMCEE